MSDPRPYAELLAESVGHMFFYMTAKQLLDGTKDVTRRLGWRDLKPGNVVRACKGNKYGPGEAFGVVLATGVRRVRLSAITADDVMREGFPDMTCHEFIGVFCKTMKCGYDDYVTRIEFEFTRTPSRQLGLF